jgi:hypothetical protein
MSELFQTKSLGTSWQMIAVPPEDQGNRGSNMQFTIVAEHALHARVHGDAGRPTRRVPTGGQTWIPLTGTTRPDRPRRLHALGRSREYASAWCWAVYDAIYFSSMAACSGSPVHSRRRLTRQPAGVGVFWDGGHLHPHARRTWA